jgi:hypothetical protein
MAGYHYMYYRLGIIKKVMAKKRTIKVCTGIGLNMFFPEYVTIELSDIDTKIRKPKTTKKNGKI